MAPAKARKFRRSGSVSSLAQAGSALAGAPSHALRRAVKRFGRKSNKVKEMNATETEDEMVTRLREEAKEDEMGAVVQKKRLQEIYCKRSKLCLRQIAHQDIGDSDAGMVRMVYSKVRSLREKKDYDNVYKRNSWKDLVGDLRHVIRVCLKAQGFINIMLESSINNQPPSPSMTWCVNYSLQKQKMWMEMLSFINKPSMKSQVEDLSKLEADAQLAEYKAMITSSAATANSSF